jgi:hypothetical protein
MTEQDEKPIRVVDRRMFTAEGELRSDFEPEDSPEAPSQPAPPPPPDGEPETPKSESPPSATREPRSPFASLVGWIATNAYSALGLLADPAGQSHADLAIARQMIEWLATLEQKTRGNLSFEESDFLSRAIYELRLAFVEVTRPKSR